jgi:hypothetical protein
VRATGSGSGWIADFSRVSGSKGGITSVDMAAAVSEMLVEKDGEEMVR